MTADDMLELIEATDWEGIESARDHVDDSIVETLLPAYWELDDWNKKVAFVNVVQDQAHDDLTAIMLDVLRAPPDPPGEETVELTKAIALGFVDEKHDRFMYYYENRRALQAAVAEVLAARGLEIERYDRVVAAPRKVALPNNATLLEAAQAGDLGRVRELLDRGTPVDDTRSEDTPLLGACMRGHEDVAILLVERGANIAAERVGGQTPIWWAGTQGLRALAKLLVARGANVNARDRHGGTALHNAAQQHGELARDLIGYGADMRARYHDERTPAWFAAYTGNTVAVVAMLDAGFGIDEETAGTTLLPLACREGHADVVRVLIARGADVNGRGKTPLMYAAERGLPMLVEQLLAAGADRNRTHDGKRALDLAGGQRAAAVRALLG
jgi:ankyrin repeat protein